jgi:hypothetical protein
LFALRIDRVLRARFTDARVDDPLAILTIVAKLASDGIELQIGAIAATARGKPYQPNPDCHRH